MSVTSKYSPMKYSKIKKIILNILPKSLLFKYEYQLRYFHYLKFRGDRYQCNICKAKVSSFIDLHNDTLCPRCGSLQRTRRLWDTLSSSYLNEDIKILDFSPSRSIYRLMKKGKYNYISSDLSGNFLADKSYDIKSIDAPKASFDLIICYHILEHIDDDIQAMKELYRVTKMNGYCIIQTPFKDGNTYEDATITSPTEREKHFGQDDHLRIYSIKDLKNRLTRVGFDVEIKNYKEKKNNKNGFCLDETQLICSKKFA